MAEISSAGLNNYVAQQSAQQTVQQASKSSGPENVEKSKTSEKSPAHNRGVIVQISKEARDLAKAALDSEDLKKALAKHGSHKDLQSAILSAKQRQNELQEAVEQDDATQANLIKEAMQNESVLAA